jgi:hypothetical protein
VMCARLPACLVLLLGLSRIWTDPWAGRLCAAGRRMSAAAVRARLALPLDHHTPIPYSSRPCGAPRLAQRESYACTCVQSCLPVLLPRMLCALCSVPALKQRRDTITASQHSRKAPCLGVCVT